MFILSDYIPQRDCCKKKKKVEKVQICVFTEYFLAFLFFLLRSMVGGKVTVSSIQCSGVNIDHVAHCSGQSKQVS